MNEESADCADGYRGVQALTPLAPQICEETEDDPPFPNAFQPWQTFQETTPKESLRYAAGFIPPTTALH